MTRHIRLPLGYICDDKAHRTTTRLYLNILCLLVRELSWGDEQTNTQTNKHTPLKTFNALRYATTLGNKQYFSHKNKELVTNLPGCLHEYLLVFCNLFSQYNWNSNTVQLVPAQTALQWHMVILSTIKITWCVLITCSHQRHRQDCLVHVGGVNTTADKTRQFPSFQ